MPPLPELDHIIGPHDPDKTGSWCPFIQYSQGVMRIGAIEPYFRCEDFDPFVISRRFAGIR